MRPATLTTTNRLARAPLLLLVGALLAGVSGAADARGKRERPPLADPLPCPIDAPVRVASADTLKRFTALDDCLPAAVIVAPATELPRARQQVIVGEAGMDAETEDAKVFLADDRNKPRAKGKRRRPQPPAARVQVASIGPSGMTVVRIAPAVQFPELEFAAAMAGSSTDALAPVVPAVVIEPGSLTDSAILALRPASYTSPHDDLIAAAAARHGVDPMMLHAVITQESRYRASAISHAGARGLMQVMPGTGAMLGVRNPAHLMDPAVNIDAGAKLLKRLWARFNGRFDLVLAAYNAGEGAVTKYGYRIPPYRETQNYVVGVQAIYRKLVAERGLVYAAR